MSSVGVVDIPVAGVFDNVALVVRGASSPIAPVVSDHFTSSRVAVGVEC